MIEGAHAQGFKPYSFANPVDIDAVGETDSLFYEVVNTAAFQRLKNIRFLGGIDYFLVRFPNGARRNIRYTRYQHSLGVARLALLYSEETNLPFFERRLIYLAALLHDIGHAPLSHSLEPVFSRAYGIDHHDAAKAILRGDVAIGRDLALLLRQHKVDVEQIVELISSKNNHFDGFFSGPINFDTIEGILRAIRYVVPTTIKPNPDTITRAALNRNSPNDMEIVDTFWGYKDAVYRHIINSRQGALADLVCQSFMVNNLSKFDVNHYYTTEAQIFEMLPGLRSILTSKNFDLESLQHLTGPLVYTLRRFFIDFSGDFYSHDDRNRYRQTRQECKLDISELDAKLLLSERMPLSAADLLEELNARGN